MPSRRASASQVPEPQPTSTIDCGASHSTTRGRTCCAESWADGSTREKKSDPYMASSGRACPRSSGLMAAMLALVLPEPRHAGDGVYPVGQAAASEELV